MRIKITGKTGYISTHLRDYFEAQGINAECISLRDGVEKADLKNTDVLIHCAALVHQNGGANAPEVDYMGVNYHMAVELAKKAKAQGVEHFVFFSTMSVYARSEGEIKDTDIAKEAGKKPVLYGTAKLLAEDDIEELREDTFKVTILRPPMVYGKDCPGNFARLKRLAEITPVFPKVDNQRGMIYIENLVKIVYEIVKEGKEGIILPQDKYVNTSEMVKKIGEAKGRNIYLSPFLGFFVQHIPLGVFKKVFGSLYYDEAIAYNGNFVDFEEAIKRSV